MIIKLNVYQNGSCAQIYAYAEDHEENYFFESYSTRNIKIWHNKHFRSLHTSIVPLNNCHNDYSVTFKSRVLFKEFCDKFYISEFNDPSKYRVFSHNCSHAANFALKLADIDLNISDGIRFTRISSPEIPISIPLKALSPSDLYCIARDYKIKTLQDQKKPLSHINFKTELASHTLHFWTKKTNDDQIKKNAITIELEERNNIHANMHHAEIYLKALIDTIDIIIDLANKVNMERYKESACFFKTRSLSLSKQLQHQQLMIIAPFSFVIGTIIYLAHDKINPGMQVALGAISWIASITNMCKFLHAVSKEGYDHTPTIKTDTPLSEAMLGLASYLEGKQKPLLFRK